MMLSSVLLMLAVSGLLHQASATNQDPSQIVVSPEDVFVYQGQTILVPCVAFIHNTSTLNSLTWTKNGVALDSGARLTAHSPMQSVVGGVLFVRAVLEVCGVEVGDTGRYSCELSVGGVEKDSVDFEVTVTSYSVPAQILVAPEDIEVPENKTVLLSCLAHAFPVPTVSWSQNGRLLELTSDSVTATTIYNEEIMEGGVRMVLSTLEVCNAQKQASGEYECTADNGLSTSSASFTLTRESPINLLSGPSHPIIRAGDDLTLTCDFHSSPLPSVTWSGVPLTNGGRFNVQETVIRNEGVEFVRSVLTVSPVANNDGGEINCTAGNGRDELIHSIDLTVTVQPQIIISPASIHNTVSNTIIMACVAHNADSIAWYKGTRELTSSTDRVSITMSQFSRRERMFVSSVLQLCEVEIENSGEYHCVAQYFAEEDTAYFDVCITEPTGLLVSPSDVTMVTDHTLSVACVGYTTLSNKHHTTLLWTRDNQPLVDSSEFTIFETQDVRGGILLIQAILLVDCIEPESSGQYACHVMSDDVINSSEFSITVLVPPRIKEPPDHSYIVSQGGTISFICLAGGDPLPTITWLKDDSHVDPDLNKRLALRETTIPGFDEFEDARESVLTIRNVAPSDGGVYECLAQSEAGLTRMEMPYLLIVNASIDSGGLNVEASGHLSYLGAIAGLVCFLAVFAVYISFPKLRAKVSTPSLVNTCLALMALNLSYIISYNTTQAGMGCTFFAALFHYFFLAAILSLTNLVVFQAKRDWKDREGSTNKKKLIMAHLLAFSLNWGFPLVIVIVSLAPDISNYSQPENGHFCGPIQWPYWFGALLPFGLIHLPTWFVFLLTTFINKRKTGLTKWLTDISSVASILLLFDIAWGIGLPSTQQANSALHILFLVFSGLLGICSLIFYCFVNSEARYEIMNIFKRCRSMISSSVKPVAQPTEQSSNQIDSRNPLNSRLASLQSEERLSFTLSGIEAGKLVQDSIVPQARSINITSFSESFTEQDLCLDDSRRGQEPESGCGQESSGSGKELEDSDVFVEEAKLDLSALEQKDDKQCGNRSNNCHYVNGCGQPPRRGSSRQSSVTGPQKVDVQVRYALV